MAREMKGSGVAWIGEIPVEWEIGKVKRFYKMTTGFTPDTKNQLFYDDNGYDWVNIADIQDGKAIWTTKKLLNAADILYFVMMILRLCYLTNGFSMTHFQRILYG